MLHCFSPDFCSQLTHNRKSIFSPILTGDFYIVSSGALSDKCWGVNIYGQAYVQPIPFYIIYVKINCIPETLLFFGILF